LCWVSIREPIKLNVCFLRKLIAESQIFIVMSYRKLGSFIIGQWRPGDRGRSDHFPGPIPCLMKDNGVRPEGGRMCLDTQILLLSCTFPGSSVREEVKATLTLPLSEGPDSEMLTHLPEY
jgi:hypothetical protein